MLVGVSRLPTVCAVALQIPALRGSRLLLRPCRLAACHVFYFAFLFCQFSMELRVTLPFVQEFGWWMWCVACGAADESSRRDEQREDCANDAARENLNERGKAMRQSHAAICTAAGDGATDYKCGRRFAPFSRRGSINPKLNPARHLPEPLHDDPILHGYWV